MLTARGGPAPRPGTINELFFRAVEKYDKPDAMLVKQDGVFRPISHRQILQRVRQTATGLARLDIERGARVAILSENRPEWAIADYACLTGGFVSVPVYPSLPPDQIAHVLADSGAVAIFVSNGEQARKLSDIKAKLPALRTVISFEPTGGRSDLTQAELEARGALGESEESIRGWRQRALEAEPDEVATIIYTSGTTGAPKGVMLTQNNFHSNVEGARRALPIEGDDTYLSFLPLSHVFERTAGHYLMLATGTSVAYAESFDKVPANLLEVQPTLVFAPPRLFEKFYARAFETALAGGRLRRHVFFWAKRTAESWADVRLAGREPGRALAARYALAQRLVFSKLRARTGGRVRCFVSGSAPLSPEINKFFYAAGLMILEGYGLTETSPVVTVNTPEHLRIGTVGKPIDGVEVAIAADGEILTRGPQVMKGYYNKPEATRAVIDADGWFHTGDIGVLDDGFLRITDRKKDIIVTAGGKNVAPQPIENRLKTNKFISQAVMIGDKRKHLVMLIVPNFEQLERWARSRKIAWSSRSELAAHHAVREMMQREMSEALAGLASFETPKKLALLEREFTVEAGELTPSLKVKRRVIDERHKDLIDSLYKEDVVAG